MFKNVFKNLLNFFVFKLTIRKINVAALFLYFEKIKNKDVIFFNRRILNFKPHLISYNKEVQWCFSLT